MRGREGFLYDKLLQLPAVLKHFSWQTVLKYLRPGTKILEEKRWEMTNSNIPHGALSLSRTHTSRSSLCLSLRIRPQGGLDKLKYPLGSNRGSHGFDFALERLVAYPNV